jgi:DNA-binding FadR family transcriptional regulator
MSRQGSTGTTLPDTAGASGRRVLSDVVAEWIAERVLDGSYPTGERLPPERELAEQLGVNRSSVREALKKLEQLRLVSIQQGSGIRACSAAEANLDLVTRLVLRDGRPDAERIRDLVELRNVLFVGLLRLGLERGTPAELDALVAALERIAEPSLPADEVPSALLRLHDSVARMAHNQIAMLLWNSIRRFMVHPPVAQAREKVSAVRMDYAPHVRRLATAIAARDHDTAVRTARELYLRVERTLESSLAADAARASRGG